VHFPSTFAQSAKLFCEICEEVSFADINHECSLANILLFFVRRHESRKRLEHGGGKIVDAEVAEILKGIGGGRHARPAEAGDDDNIR